MARRYASRTASWMPPAKPAWPMPALDGTAAGGALQIVDSTVIGTVHTVLLELASNTIFLAALAPAPEDKADTQLAPIMAQRRQAGCVRFSFLPLSAVVPPRFRCQPPSQSEEDACARSSPRCIMAIRAMGNSPHTVPERSALVPTTRLKWGLGIPCINHSGKSTCAYGLTNICVSAWKPVSFTSRNPTGRRRP